MRGETQLESQYKSTALQTEHAGTTSRDMGTSDCETHPHVQAEHKSKPASVPAPETRQTEILFCSCEYFNPDPGASEKEVIANHHHPVTFSLGRPGPCPGRVLTGVPSTPHPRVCPGLPVCGGGGDPGPGTAERRVAV